MIFPQTVYCWAGAGVLNATLDLAASVLVAVVAFLGSEMVYGGVICILFSTQNSRVFNVFNIEFHL